MGVPKDWEQPNRKEHPFFVCLYFVGNTISIPIKDEQWDEVERQLSAAVAGKITDPPIRSVNKLNGFHFCCDVLIGYTLCKWEDKPSAAERQVKASEEAVAIMKKGMGQGEEWKSDEEDE